MDIDSPLVCWSYLFLSRVAPLFIDHGEIVGEFEKAKEPPSGQPAYLGGYCALAPDNLVHARNGNVKASRGVPSA